MRFNPCCSLNGSSRVQLDFPTPDASRRVTRVTPAVFRRRAWEEIVRSRSMPRGAATIGIATGCGRRLVPLCSDQRGHRLRDSQRCPICLDPPPTTGTTGSTRTPARQLGRARARRRRTAPHRARAGARPHAAARRYAPAAAARCSTGAFRFEHVAQLGHELDRRDAGDHAEHDTGRHRSGFGRGVGDETVSCAAGLRDRPGDRAR